MSFKLGKKSLEILGTVHSDMQKVVHEAIRISDIDFGVVQGKRTIEDQYALYGQGRSKAQCAAAGVPEKYSRPDLPVVTKTTKSNHLSGRAVDLVPYVAGKLDWDNSGKKGYWPRIEKAMKTAARNLGIKIVWGGDWKSFVDRPHFELA